MSQRLTMGALRTLAALILVDGRTLSADELARIAMPWGGARKTPADSWIPQLRAADCRIQTMDYRGTGYRLLAIPPDDLLDDVLVIVHALRWEHPTRLWELFGRPVATSPSRAAPSRASSARRSA